MGGDHHGFGEKMKIPDYRIYKVEDVPLLVQLQKTLASQGLKDPWLRNEVWRYDSKLYGTPRGNMISSFTKGMKWGFVAFVATIALEQGIGLLTKKDDHGHGHH